MTRRLTPLRLVLAVVRVVDARARGARCKRGAGPCPSDARCVACYVR